MYYDYKKKIFQFVNLLNKINPLYFVYEKMRRRVIRINHNGRNFLFSAPNSLCKYRADTFSSKEPDTLHWIDNFDEGEVFFDIGANVGLYSVYAAKTRNCRVFSFEPSVFNLEVLSRNIFLNELTNKIQILPIALNNSNSVGLLNMSSTNIGGALSTFNQTYGYDGTELKVIFKLPTLSMRMDSVIEFLKIPSPKYIKIDVDGIEHLILQGGESVLKNADQILIEVSRDFIEQKKSLFEILEKNGFRKKMYTENELKIYGINEADTAHNQIWVKR
jgi:FkbM family methyltransferase